MSRNLKTYEFTLILSGFSELTETAMDLLYEAGCSDGLLCLDKHGVPFVEFQREAASFDDAVRSAIQDIRQTPFRVVRVETETSKTVAEINSELATVQSE